MPQISLSLLTALLWPARLLLPPILSFFVLDAKGGERVCRFRGSFVRGVWFFCVILSCIIMFKFPHLHCVICVLVRYFGDMLVVLSILYIMSLDWF
jgi:hypothetical protein